MQLVTLSNHLRAYALGPASPTVPERPHRTDLTPCTNAASHAGRALTRSTCTATDGHFAKLSCTYKNVLSSHAMKKSIRCGECKPSLFSGAITDGLSAVPSAQRIVSNSPETGTFNICSQ